MRMYALGMTRPHETLGLPQPLGRKLPSGILGWNFAVLGVMVSLCVLYVAQVNHAASRGFQLQDVQRRVERLQIDVTALEDKVATMSSVKELTARAEAQGLVPVDRLEFARPGGKLYALAH